MVETPSKTPILLACLAIVLMIAFTAVTRRYDSDGRRVLRRYRWQLLCARCRKRLETLGPRARRRDRRRCDHLYGRQCAKSCCGERLYDARLAHQDRDRQDRSTGPRQRLREPMTRGVSPGYSCPVTMSRSYVALDLHSLSALMSFNNRRRCDRYQPNRASSGAGGHADEQRRLPLHCSQGNPSR
jgi:hypothetical protein